MSDAPTSRQLVLDLPVRPALGRADFFVSPANAIAVAMVDRWPDWPMRRLAVVGPQGAGKSHLAHVWSARAGAAILPVEALAELALGEIAETAALAVEDADRVGALGADAEEALFHLCNRLAARGSLMLSGREPPARWPVALPDLASRLEAAPVARLEPPDDALLGAVLVKLFSDRQIVVGLDLVNYLVARIDRSFAAAESLVARLDQAGLARHRPITVRLAAEVLFGDAPGDDDA